MGRAAAILLCLLLLGWVFPPQQARARVVDPYQTYTYEQLNADLSSLAAAYPRLVAEFSIGQTVQGREIPALRCGRGKREIIICAAMHGREHITCNHLMRLIENALLGYEQDSYYQGRSYRQMLENVTFIMVPMLNPDGVSIAQSGNYEWKANANGVDLNRNYPNRWNPHPQVKTPAKEEYRGAYAGSEPETQAMLELLKNTPFYMLISLHSMGEVIYWLDTDTTAYASAHRPIARRLAASVGYELLPTEDVRSFAGYLVNYARKTYGKFCATLELCPYTETLPYPLADFDNTAGKIASLLLLLAEETVKLPAGAEAVDVLVEDMPVAFPDQRPVILNSRTLVPLRAVLERCGIAVSWDQATATAYATDGNIQVQLTIGSPLMLADGEIFILDTAPCLINGRTMLPLRAVAEAFGWQVSWDGSRRTVYLNR